MTYSNQPYIDDPAPDESGDGAKPAVAKQEASQVADVAKAHASEVAGTAQANAQQVLTDAKEHAVSLVGEAQGQLAGLLDQAQTEFGGRSAEQATKAAANLRSVSGQLSALAEGRPQDAPKATGYLRQAASRVEAYAERLDQDGVGGLTRDVTGFARRRPGLFLVGAAAAGFVAGRLVKGAKSGTNEDDGHSEQTWSAPPPAPPAVGTSAEWTAPATVGQRPSEDPRSAAGLPAGTIGDRVPAAVDDLLPPTYLSGREGGR